VPGDEQVIIVAPVVMEENTALGLNSVMLPGSAIGANSWVGVLSSVMGAIPANVIASGAPAVVVKERK
jgi:acetyltransferase-like isoleucine patch superfamily enzyme